jgi:hypothetical protein
MRSSKNVVLLEGAGPVDGPYDVANSTRCELGGFAASILLLSLMQKLWGTQHKCKLRWVTDSKAAMSNVNKALDDSRLTKRQPNNPDLLAIIHTEINSFRRRIKPIWVKGHQNSTGGNQSNGNSHHDVQGNNRADELATWYREASGKRQSIESIDHVGESQVSISVNGTRLVSQVEGCIRYHIDGYHLRQYLQVANKWTDRTWETIDVEVLGAYLKRLDAKSQIARTKFVFNQWHTGFRRHQFSPVKDNDLLLCPCCKAEIETTTHVLQCKKNPVREKCISSFRKAMSPINPHPVFTILKGGIISWLQAEEEYNVDVDIFPTKFRPSATKGLEDQTTIGWEFAIKGYLSVEWRYMANVDMFDGTSQQEGSGLHIIKTILKATHQLTQAIWHSRNEVLHGSDGITLKNIRQIEIAEIIDIHGHPELVPAGDRHYCEQTLKNILERAPSTRRRWLRHMRSARLRFTKEGQRQALITTFFRREDRKSCEA